MEREPVPPSPLTAKQQQMIDAIMQEHPGLHEAVAAEAVRGAENAAGKSGPGTDLRLLGGGGREVSVHIGAFTSESVAAHLQAEAAQAGTTEIYLQINTAGATREATISMASEMRLGYPDLKGKYVRLFGPT